MVSRFISLAIIGLFAICFSVGLLSQTLSLETQSSISACQTETSCCQATPSQQSSTELPENGFCFANNLDYHHTSDQSELLDFVVVLPPTRSIYPISQQITTIPTWVEPLDHPPPPAKFILLFPSHAPPIA